MALAAGTVPMLLALNLLPSVTVPNQCAALILWGAWTLVLAPARLPRAAWPLVAALALVAAGALWSTTVASLPASLGLSALGVLAGALLLAWTGANAARRADGAAVFGWFADGLLLAGLVSALIAMLQVFAPEFGAAGLIARSHIAGRAIGNLRQPNLLCSLLQWALVAIVLRLERGRMPALPAWGAAAAMVFAIELSGSRTGAVGLVLLALWGALDRRLGRSSRRMLLALPLLFALAFAAMALYGDWAHRTIGAATRLADAGNIDNPNARLNIWANALKMIAREPWAGVGFGEFNLAWTLTAFPDRPTAFFDHTHNLPLQLAVELGLPLGGSVLVLLGLALWRAWRRSRGAAGDDGVAARASWMMVVVIAFHSLVEYPLWYAQFLLPAAFAWGYALGVPGPREPTPGARSRWAGIASALALIAGGAYGLADYVRIAEIYRPGLSAASLEPRIVRGQRSMFFAHHADYAAALAGRPGAASDLGFERAIHNLLGSWLMMAWARHLADADQGELARALAARLREFRSPDTADFFARCEPSSSPDAGAGKAGPPFQCQAARLEHGWREFVRAAATER